MSVKTLADYSVTRHRAIMFHGKHSMRDMNLMMVGSTPLSPVTPKIVREEVAYGDGDLDLSRVDGELYFNTRTITYTFVLAEEFNATVRTRAKTTALVNHLSDIYKWLYQDSAGYSVTNRDIFDGGSAQVGIGYVSPTEMFDSAYGSYKFTGATVTDIQVSKMMFDGVWLESLEITFTCDPYMQTFVGARVDIATFVDRAITARNVQTVMMIYENNRYWLNDFFQWFSKDNASRLDSKKWRFRIRVPYAGIIGFRLAPSCTMNGVTYEINTAYGQDTTLYFLDNEHPGETITSHQGGYGYTQPVPDSNGYLVIDFVVDFVETWTPENPPWIVLEWGVMRNYTVPDQTAYIMDAYTKSNTATMYVGDADGHYSEQDFSTAFTLTTRPLNEIHIRNVDYDGLYKFRYDTTTRRL